MRLKESSSNGVSGRIARGVATTLAILSGANSPQISNPEFYSNNDSRHQEVIIGTPGASDSAMSKTSRIEPETIAKKKKERGYSTVFIGS